MVCCSGGSDWRTIQLLEVDLDTGDAKDLQDKLEHVKFSATAWTHDNKVSPNLDFKDTVVKAQSPTSKQAHECGRASPTSSVECKDGS